MEGMPAQPPFRQLDLLQGQGGQALLQARPARQQAEQFAALAVGVFQAVEQVEHAAALGQQRLAGGMVGSDRLGHGAIALQAPQVQFGVAARQVQAVHGGQRLVLQRREERQFGAEFAQQVEIGLVEEGERGIASHADAHAFQAALQRRRSGHLEGHRLRQVGLGAGPQGVGGGVQARIEIGQFLGLDQAQVAARQFEFGRARQAAEPAHAGRQAIAQDVAVALAADAVAEHSGKRQVRLEMRQAVGQRAEGLGHRRAVDHPQHRHAETPRQVCRRGVAIEQAHHPFDEDQVGLAGGPRQQASRFGLADHPQVELVDRRAGGAGEDHRVEEVRPALEHPYPPPLARMQAGQGGGDGGLALAGGRGGDQQGRTACLGHGRSVSAHGAGIRIPLLSAP